MNPTDCLVFLATSCVLLFSVGLYTLAESISEPIPGALFIRTRRDAGRAMTFSGYFPHGSMSAYASSGDWGQWYKGRGNRRPIEFPEQGWSSRQTQPPTEEETTPEAGEDWKEEAHNDHDHDHGVNREEQRPTSNNGVNREEQRPTFNKKPKKKPTYHKDKSSEEEDEDEPVSHGNSGGNAAASFNAWFPIMLGMFPPSQEGVNGYSSSSRKSPLHTTVVANSVSHGPGGVASSHAVAYGGQPEYRGQQPQQH
ncbi:uncharacterized protein LOC142333927 [Lycorma delicatula]|uniref:uncharacterized protein LOC142333927 n=1 Tax=Lycorma delicatula TaxID=130591 RepID=UPI003F512C9B